MGQFELLCKEPAIFLCSFKHEPAVFVSKEFTVSELYRSSPYIKDTLAYLSDNDELFVSILIMKSLLIMLFVLG